MTFQKIYYSLRDLFPMVDDRALRAVAIDHINDADAAVEAVLEEIIHFFTERSAPTSPLTWSAIAGESSYGSSSVRTKFADQADDDHSFFVSGKKESSGCADVGLSESVGDASAGHLDVETHDDIHSQAESLVVVGETRGGTCCIEVLEDSQTERTITAEDETSCSSNAQPKMDCFQQNKDDADGIALEVEASDIDGSDLDEYDESGIDDYDENEDEYDENGDEYDENDLDEYDENDLDEYDGNEDEYDENEDDENEEEYDENGDEYDENEDEYDENDLDEYDGNEEEYDENEDDENEEEYDENEDDENEDEYDENGDEYDENDLDEYDENDLDEYDGNEDEYDENEDDENEEEYDENGDEYDENEDEYDGNEDGYDENDLDECDENEDEYNGNEDDEYDENEDNEYDESDLDESNLSSSTTNSTSSEEHLIVLDKSDLSSSTDRASRGKNMSNTLGAVNETTLNSSMCSQHGTNIDNLEEIIANARNNKKTLFMEMESVINLMKQVEVKEHAAEQAKTEAARVEMDLQNEIKELKITIKHAKESNDMHAGDVCGEKVILTTELRDLHTRLVSLSNDRDKSLADLDEMRQCLEVRLAAAENEIESAVVKRFEDEKCGKLSLIKEKLIMEQVVQESKNLRQQAEDNAKLHAFLVDRGQLVDTLQGEIAVICQDVKQLKEKFDQRLPLSRSLFSTQTSFLLASSNSSLKSSVQDQVEAVAVRDDDRLETGDHKKDPEDELASADPKALAEDDDGWVLF
ncbi:hypothetical protein SASPL_135174 [Salvia splendens]|uniref:CUE domain-containing protein n=1 Tax=Salvia splendens TaxID=180675 RepID=A0A8X8ZGD5_SALSN|nr:kinesin-related protein 4-like [Salvia splendens]KAG6402959.1 hypothetical protein SASPL_135174 [Salvia splendens]